MIFSMMSSRIVSLRDERAVLAGDDDRVDADRLVAVVFDGDLRFAVGAQVVERAVAAQRTTGPCTSLCASMIGSGISSSVSVQAKPNIRPWSPAPPVSTPIAMSGDWLWIDDSTAQVSASKPYLPRV